MFLPSIPPSGLNERLTTVEENLVNSYCQSSKQLHILSELAKSLSKLNNLNQMDFSCEMDISIFEPTHSYPLIVLYAKKGLYFKLPVKRVPHVHLFYVIDWFERFQKKVPQSPTLNLKRYEIGTSAICDAKSKHQIFCTSM